MLLLHRNFENFSIGFFQNDKPGFPTANSKKHWIGKCNFVFTILYKVVSIDAQQKLGIQDEYSGWIAKCAMKDKDEVNIYIRNDCASSNSGIKKIFLKSISGCICRFTCEDFWRFVAEDVHDRSLQTCFISPRCGKVYFPNSDKYIWAFPSRCISYNGKYVNQSQIFVTESSIGIRSNGEKMIVPANLPDPNPISDKQKTLTILKEFGGKLKNFYGPRICHAIHVLGCILKSLNRDELLKHEHQVSIMNISGIANVGKTLISSMALRMMGAPSLMLSRCTSSAMLDYADMFKNMLIVWDDPRDACDSQLCSIVHEAFHGNSVSSISKGNRSYNSTIIIGTQNKLLGLTQTHLNLPTFSRLSHVDFNYPTHEFQPCRKDEDEFQKFLENHDINCFGLLTTFSYNKKEVDKLYDILLKQTNNVIQRSVRILAIDWYFSKQMSTLLNINSGIIDNYFKNSQTAYLNKYCSQTNALDEFVNFLKQLDDIPNIPSHFYKSNVQVDMNGNQPCIAFYSKEFFPYIHNIFPKSSICQESDILHQIKMSNGNIGIVGKNVAFQTPNKTIKIRRAVVIRKSIISA
jgi:hypothetical protein